MGSKFYYYNIYIYYNNRPKNGEGVPFFCYVTM